MGWVLGAVGAGDALGDPARSVTGDLSGHQCQHMGTREGHTATVEEDRQPVGRFALLFSKLIPSSQTTRPPHDCVSTSRQIMHAPVHPRRAGRSCRDPLWPYLLRLSSFPAPSSLSPVTHDGA